jgi:osmotically-inducible protein OsmY
MSFGRYPYPNRAPNPRQFYIGPYGPYQGQVKIDDGIIKNDIESALFYDSWVDSHDVKVDVKDGVVTLTGTVSSSFEKRAAGDDAWDAPGVRDVQNGISISENPQR